MAHTGTGQVCSIGGKGVRFAAALLVTLAAAAAPGLLAPVHAAAESLQIDKIVDKTELAPGDTFTYTIQVRCVEEDCLGTTLVDELPDELVGFPIQQVTFDPSSTPTVVTWQPGGTSTPPAEVTADTSLSVEIQQPTTNPVGTGLIAGQQFTVSISLQVPADYPPGNSGPILNTASVSADNADTQTSDATVTIDSQVDIAVSTDKTWDPGSQDFEVGAPSEIGLDVTNTSNTAVDEIVLQEPKAAPDGAATLDPSNPFTITDFTGFNDVSLPAGCDSVQVDAYVFNGSTWGWQAGNPSTGPPLTLPAGVTNADVGGIRITCTGTMEPGEAISVDLDLAQRAADRDTGADLSTAEHTVDNVATGSADLAGEDPATDDGNASHTILPSIPTVEAFKDIDGDSITAGQSVDTRIRGTVGDEPVSELHLADLDFFTSEVTFGGFTAPPTPPSGATGAEIIYHPLDGDPETISIPFAPGDTPPDPPELISGFEIVWTGDTIDANSTGQVDFTIDTSEDATGGAAEVTLTNTVDVDVTAPNGLTDSDTDSDSVRVVNPDIETSLDKLLRPSSNLEPGDSVIGSLSSTTNALGDNATVNDIVIEDSWDGTGSNFWNAFDLASIAPTQVPADTVLTVEVFVNGSWQTLTVYGPEPSATVFSMTDAELDAALGSLGVSASDVEGIRFSFHNDDGFPANINLVPNIEFQVRDDQRDGGDLTPGPDQPTTYTNTATIDADGESDGGRPLHDDDDATDDATVVTEDGGGGGTGPGTDVDIDKSWVEAAVNSQSGERATSHLDWNVGEGFAAVAITDTADPTTTPVAQTTYEAFDLVAINPIAVSAEPYTNGWYLNYDTVTTIELYDGASWTVVPAPGGSWMEADRSFKGYTLSAGERASTVGVRITVEETAADTAAREAAREVGPAFDPFAPLPDGGVGYGSTDRRFDLVWEVRDTARSDGRFVVEEELYNTPDQGLVDNTTRIIGTPLGGGGDVTGTADDTIQILDPSPPAVDVTKGVTPTEEIFTPVVGTPAEDYPTATWTVTGHNASASRATYVRITDPATCTDTTLDQCQTTSDDGPVDGALADPFDPTVDYLTETQTPWDRFTITGLTIAASIPAEVNETTSIVWLLHYDPLARTYSTTSISSVANANNLTAAELADVVGVSVTWEDLNVFDEQGSITQDNLLSITFDSILRPTIRSTGEDQVLVAGETLDVTNRAFAQSYDPVTSPGVATGDVDDATVTLTGGIVNINPTKTISPTIINEPDPDVPVTVTLAADQGSDPRSTLSPQQVVITDQADAVEFFNEFEFTGLGAVTLPDGADRVRIDLYDGSDWVLGTAGPTASLPAVPFADVQGIRCTFDRADGELFSPVVPAPNWAASCAFTVQLRATYRDSGDPVTFDHTVTDVQSSQSTRPDGNDSEVLDDDATIELSPGTHELAVNKLTNGGNRLASVGDMVPFDLTIQNVGTGYLTLTGITDTLPPELVYTGDPAPEFTADPDGGLSEDVTVTPNADGSQLTFTWPEGGNRMDPGETFTIRLYLELQPGLGTGETATNTMVAGTEEDLDVCRNTVDGGNLTDDWAEDVTTCGTFDDVGVVVGPNLYTIKGVRGALGGASVPTDPEATCAPVLVATPGTAVATDGRFFRTPCVANSLVDGVDDWVLHSANSGTVPIAEMTVFDQLPVAGDSLLVSGSDRGSDYRPQIVPGSLVVTAPADTTYLIEVTTSTGVCEGTWADLETQPVCEQNGEVWVAADGSTDWSQVTGLRVAFDFSSTATGNLEPGEIVDVNYSMVNVLETAADPSGASAVVPVGEQFAYNQHGIKFRYDGVGEFRRIAPGQVGVQLLPTALIVTKQITGPAAAYAPDEFLVDVTCTVGDVELDLGDDAVVELTADNAFTVRIDGLPLSTDPTSCTLAEQGDVGTFGETSRDGTPATIDLITPVTADDPDDVVPGSQVVTIGNDYQFTGLSVTKRVDTDAVDTDFGPFTFELTCETATGVPVEWGPLGRTVLEFTIEADETFTTPADRIPVGSTCTLTETDDYFADNIVITGDNVVDNGDGSASITPGEEPAEVEVTNAYDAGTVTIVKDVDGDGAALWGAGPFTFTITCTYQDQVVNDATFELGPGDSLTVGPYPAGTQCVVAETGDGGADTTVLDPEDGVVVVPGPEEEGGTTQVTITALNTFELTSLEVDKVVSGDLDAPGAAGPFRVELTCTRLVDGESVEIEIPGGAERVLSAANGYHATYGELPASADCTLVETDDGGAADTGITVEITPDAELADEGEEVAEPTTEIVDGTTVDVDLSVTTGPGQALVTIDNAFAEVGGESEGLPGAGSRIPGWLAPMGALLLLLGLVLVGAVRREA